MINRLAFLFLLLTVVAGFGDIITLQPGVAESNDVVAFNSDPSSNYDEFGVVGCEGSSGPDGAIEGFLEFTELDDYQGWNLTSATLEVYVTDLHNSGTYQLGAADAAWDESTLTWNNRPGCITGSVTSYSYPSSYEFHQIDVTTLVAAWLNGTYTNHGFVFFDDSGADRFWGFREAAPFYDSQHFPELILDIEDTAVVETSWGEIKALK